GIPVDAEEPRVGRCLEQGGSVSPETDGRVHETGTRPGAQPPHHLLHHHRHVHPHVGGALRPGARLFVRHRRLVAPPPPPPPPRHLLPPSPPPTPPRLTRSCL